MRNIYKQIRRYGKGEFSRDRSQNPEGGQNQFSDQALREWNVNYMDEFYGKKYMKELAKTN